MAPEQQDKPLHELLSRSMVDIYVGSENTHWVLHEKLLCYHSPFFRNIFYAKNNTSKTYGLPDEEDATFKTFVGWLYSSTLPVPREEADLGVLFDLYLLSEKLEIPRLSHDILATVREWYKFSDTYPGLRRVQYIYANTEEGSPMRVMLVHAVARMLVVGDSGKGDGQRMKGIPQHWDKALRKNGTLAVDLIRAVQEWGLDEQGIPDARDESWLGEELVDDEAVGLEEGEGQEEEQEQAQEQEQDQEGEIVQGEEQEQKQESSGIEAEGEEEDEEEEEEEEEQDEEDEEEEAHDSSEDTVVESPTEEKHQTPKTKDARTPHKRSDSAVSGDLQKNFTEVPNTVSLDDYGTLGSH